MALELVHSGTETSYVDTDADRTGGKSYSYAVSAVDTAGNEGPLSTMVTFVASANVKGIEELAGHPKSFALFQNRPNPFNMGTVVRYDVPVDCYVKITVYDILGRPVKVLHAGVQRSGEYLVRWDGTDENGEPLPSGLYICQLVAKDIRRSIKMVLLR